MKPSQSDGRSQVVGVRDGNSKEGWLRRRAVQVVALLALAYPACSAGPLPESEHADIAEPARHLFPPPALSSPADGATLLAEQPLFTWRIDKCHERIRLELCADAACAVVKQTFESKTCMGTRAPTELAPGMYFWRAVRVRGQHLASTFSEVWRFLLAAPPPAVTADLYGVWSVSESDVFVVGAGGTILRYGGAWSAETSPTTQTLHAVWATGGGQAFAVGAGGTILHRDGATWSAIASPTTVDLTGVWGSSSSDVWAVGGSLILHWNGTSFTVAHDRMAGALRGISGIAADDIWVTGSGREPDEDYAALLLHWDGTSWSESYVCNPEGTRLDRVPYRYLGAARRRVLCGGCLPVGRQLHPVWLPRAEGQRRRLGRHAGLRFRPVAGQVPTAAHHLGKQPQRRVGRLGQRDRHRHLRAAHHAALRRRRLDPLAAGHHRRHHRSRRDLRQRCLGGRQGRQAPALRRHDLDRGALTPRATAPCTSRDAADCWSA